MNLLISVGLRYFCTGEKELLGGQRIGFVIFYGVQDAEVFLSKLQEIRVNDLPLCMNMRWLSLRVVGWWQGEEHFVRSCHSPSGVMSLRMSGIKKSSPSGAGGDCGSRQGACECFWKLLCWLPLESGSSLILSSYQSNKFRLQFPLPSPMRPLQSTLVGKSHPPYPKLNWTAEDIVMEKLLSHTIYQFIKKLSLPRPRLWKAEVIFINSSLTAELTLTGNPRNWIGKKQCDMTEKWKPYS